MMNEVSLEFNNPPEFITDAEGKPTVVALETAAYVKLLVHANVVNPALWPPGMQEGAKALAQVREIERECVAQYGEFDWEKLPEVIQDEYDSLCLLLDELQDMGKWVEWEDYKTWREVHSV